MVRPDEVVRIIAVDPEMHGILCKMLGGLDESDDFPHVMIGHGDAFADPVTWFATMQDQLEVQLLAYSESLASLDIARRDAAKDPALRGPWPFLMRAEHFAMSLPDDAGALVFVIDPERVDDVEGFARSIAFLATEVRTPWLKFVVLDERLAPRLATLAADHPRIASQTFWCSPNEMESRLRAALADSALSGFDERKRIMATVASLAFSNRDYAKAEALQRQVLDIARTDGTPIEQAIGFYGLGNTLLAARQTDAAVESFMTGCQICSEHGLNELAPMLYTNFGVALQRLGNFDEAFAALRVASRFFRAQGNRPGEAFVCDNLALIYQQLDRRTEAAQVWRYALELYEGITNPAMADVREAGRSDIVSKLVRLDGLSSGR